QGTSSNNGGSSVFTTNNFGLGSTGTNAGNTATSPKNQNNNFTNTFNNPLQGISANTFQPSAVLNSNNAGTGGFTTDSTGSNGGFGQQETRRY
ncbi:MAG: hypothetical protein K2X66_13270, partial [Cyanobacteria bacterium]|nr:hypothetical protein [Cyanobacteriota bacterium]